MRVTYFRPGCTPYEIRVAYLGAKTRGYRVIFLPESAVVCQRLGIEFPTKISRNGEKRGYRVIFLIFDTRVYGASEIAIPGVMVNWDSGKLGVGSPNLSPNLTVNY